ncbi:GNAT family N-acetyltransferase [Hymenobacter terricola]|uniref:GNAT family N-acetyltransferase n=1 Tax=Hymenobacter terricola TaxID=2819236 RepID=UPI001B309155|nr:GNAT family N-acetyltransferase [Hymenobacter terricola]
MPPILLAISDAQILACWPALHLLRPRLVYETFLAQIQDMRQHGYALAYLETGGEVVAVMGFRYLTQLYAGRTLYIDDLSTLPAAQGRGYGSHLLDYALELAQTRRLDGVALDSAFAREAAHRLYRHKGFEPVAFHFYHSLAAA